VDHLTRWDLFLACLAAAATIGAAIIAVLVTFHMQNRKDAKNSDERLRAQLIEHPLHSHGEVTPFAKPSDPLTVEGVRYPRRANGN
jgi:hypothetical protein